jgi:hypothetical protein
MTLRDDLVQSVLLRISWWPTARCIHSILDFEITWRLIGYQPAAGFSPSYPTIHLQEGSDGRSVGVSLGVALSFETSLEPRRQDS